MIRLPTTGRYFPQPWSSDTIAGKLGRRPTPKAPSWGPFRPPPPTEVAPLALEVALAAAASQSPPGVASLIRQARFSNATVRLASRWRASM